jgi:probable rRNA maturation factor
MATASYRIAFHVKPAFARFVRIRTLAALARRVLAVEEVVGPLELSIAVTDDRAMRTLNRRYRGQDAPTDVLSFGLGPDAGFIVPPGRPRQLGEIVISYPTAARQARMDGQSVHDELAHLLVHGVLHLLGYDHERPPEAKTMRAREERLLGRAPH